MKPFIIAVSIAALVTTAQADYAEGEELFQDSKCLECHNLEEFEDPKQIKSKNFEQMENMVSACQISNDAGWFDDETHSVAEYLNKKYFKFKK